MNFIFYQDHGIIKHMKDIKNVKVAIICEYLNQYGGAEKTMETILELFPNATLYTGIYDPSKMSETINSKKIICPKNSLLLKFPKYFTFLMPLIFESFDLKEYDLIISNANAWAKSVLTKPTQLHISYIHTPPRFLYKYSVESQKRDAWYFKPIIPFLDFVLRIWDFNAAQRPDYILTNSYETQSRIKKFYHREAKVIYPPLDTSYINGNNKDKDLDASSKDKYYLVIGRLSAYKNFDLVIKAFNILRLPLVVAGTGIEENYLKTIANENIKFVGRVSEEKKAELFKNCLGVINAVQDEDFGIVPIEAMSYGKPVFAHKSGGHLETIQDKISGVFFEDLTLEGFIEAFKVFDNMISQNSFDKNKIKESVTKFDKEIFKNEIWTYISEKFNEHFK